MSVFLMKFRLQKAVLRRSMGSLAYESFGNPLSVLAVNNASHDSLLPSDNKDLTIKIASSYILPEDLRRINGISFYPNYGKNKGMKLGGSSGIGQVKASKKSDIAVGDQVYVLSNGTWCDTINVNSSDVIKLPSTIKSEEVAALPSLVSAYTLLTNYKSNKIYQLNGDSAYGKDLTMVGKALGLEVVNVTVADLEKVSDLNLLITPTSVIHNSKGITKPLGLNGKIVVYNDGSSPTAAYGAVDVPVASQIFKVTSITGYDYHIWALNNHSQHAQNVNAVVKLIADKKINGVNGAKTVPLSEYKNGITSSLTGANGVVLKF